MRRLFPVWFLCVFILLFSVPALAFENFNPYSGREFEQNPNRYYLEIDVTNQVAVVYERDSAGHLTKALRYMPITSGMPGYSTPRGTFRLPGCRERFGYFIEYNVYAQYHTQIVRGVYVHSFLYSKRDVNTPQIGTYNRLGNTGSHGCVRMRVEDARWIYYNCPKGTLATIKSAPKNAELRKKAAKVPWKQYNPGVDPNPVPAPIYGRVLVDSALRAGPAHGNDLVAKISAGDKVELLQFSDVWIKVRIPSDSARPKEGFMQRDFVAFLAETQTPEYVRVYKTRMIISPVYSGPSHKTQIIDRLEYLTPVKVLETDGKYSLISYGNNKQGWINKAYAQVYTVARK